MMKDATNSDMPREVVSRQRSGDFRMGQPNYLTRNYFLDQYILFEGATQGIETS